MVQVDGASLACQSREDCNRAWLIVQGVVFGAAQLACCVLLATVAATRESQLWPALFNVLVAGSVTAGLATLLQCSSCGGSATRARRVLVAFFVWMLPLAVVNLGLTAHLVHETLPESTLAESADLRSGWIGMVRDASSRSALRTFLRDFQESNACCAFDSQASQAQLLPGYACSMPVTCEAAVRRALREHVRPAAVAALVIACTHAAVVLLLAASTCVLRREVAQRAFVSDFG